MWELMSGLIGITVNLEGREGTDTRWQDEACWYIRATSELNSKN